MVSNWVNVSGDQTNEPILLISGLGGTAAFWSPVQQGLATNNFLVSYDQPGCGARAHTSGKVSISSLAHDAAEVIRAVFGHRRVTVIGHSTGGAIAQQLAVIEPGLVKRLVLSGTWLVADEYMHALFRYRQALLSRAPELAVGLTEILSQEPADINCERLALRPLGDIEIENNLNRIDALLAFDGAAFVSQVLADTLVLGARNDRVVPVCLQEKLHSELPKSELNIFPEGGHFFPKFSPEKFISFVGSWLASKNGL